VEDCLTKAVDYRESLSKSIHLDVKVSLIVKFSSSLSLSSSALLSHD
jgi:hypothetical protein